MKSAPGQSHLSTYACANETKPLRIILTFLRTFPAFNVQMVYWKPVWQCHIMWRLPHASLVWGGRNHCRYGRWQWRKAREKVLWSRYCGNRGKNAWSSDPLKTTWYCGFLQAHGRNCA